MKWGMNDRDTLAGARVARTPRKATFGWGWAIMSMILFLIVACLTTCDQLPEDYSRLRSESADYRQPINQEARP